MGSWKNKLKPTTNRPYWQVLSMQPKPDATYCSVPYSCIVIPKLFKKKHQLATTLYYLYFFS